MWMAFLCSACLIIAFAHRLKTHPAPPPSASFVGIIAAVGAMDFVFMGIIRRTQLLKADDLKERGDTEAAQKTWMMAQLLGFAGGESIVLFGLMQRVMGVHPSWISIAFYCAGLLLLLACRPDDPPGEA
jgi:hypothetical protein